MKIAEEPLYAALSEDNALADCQELRLDDLDGCPWAVFSKAADPHVHETVLRLAGERDIRPGELHEVLVADEAYSYVADHNAVALFYQERGTSNREGRDHHPPVRRTASMPQMFPRIAGG